MKKRSFTCIVFLVAILISTSVDAQKLKKYYTERVQEGGDLFFLYENDDFKGANTKSDFLFDVTMRQDTDSVYFNFTYFCKKASPADSLYILTPDVDIKVPVSKLFIDFEKKEWEHRYGATLKYDDFKSLIDQTDPPRLKVVTDNKKLLFDIKTRKWHKYIDAISKVLYVFETD